MKPTFFKGIALGAATCFVMLAVTSALAGTGIGDVFNLGQVNSVDDTSTLQGNVPAGAQLLVHNQGNGAAVRGESNGGRGVVGTHDSANGTNPGVEGDTSSDDNAAVGVLGRVLPSAPGMDSAAVRGINLSTQADRYGVWGSANGSGSGVFGQAKGGSGVHGEGTTGTGVLGTADTGTGLRGLSNSGRGLQAQNLSTTRSVNGDQPGVFGTSFADDGGQFVTSKGTAVCAASGAPCGNAGNEVTGVGLYATSTNANAIWASSTVTTPLALDGPANVPPMTLNSTQRVTNLNADYLDGQDSTGFLRSTIQAFQTGPTIGKDLSGGTCGGNEECYATVGCNPTVEHMLSGGFEFMDPGTVLESNAPTAANTWRVQWKNNSTVDSLNLRVLCVVTPA
jgi:hypothetical protein